MQRALPPPPQQAAPPSAPAAEPVKLPPAARAGAGSAGSGSSSEAASEASSSSLSLAEGPELEEEADPADAQRCPAAGPAAAACQAAREPAQLELACHAAYHPSYQVPVLYFEVRRSTAAGSSVHPAMRGPAIPPASSFRPDAGSGAQRRAAGAGGGAGGPSAAAASGGWRAALHCRHAGGALCLLGSPLSMLCAAAAKAPLLARPQSKCCRPACLQEHPFLHCPFFLLHPCQTAVTMQLLRGPAEGGGCATAAAAAGGGQAAAAAAGAAATAAGQAAPEAVVEAAAAGGQAAPEQAAAQPPQASPLRYLLAWLSVAGQVLGLRLPAQLWRGLAEPPP